MLDADWKHLSSMWLVIASLSGLALWFAAKAGRVVSVAALLALFQITLVVVLLSGERAHAVYFQVAVNITTNL